MYIAICDDIRAQAEELARLVTGYYGKDNVTIYIYDRGKALAAALKNKKTPVFDLIFLDILMPVHNGITVAEYIRRRDAVVPIIFVTSTKDYAIQGYRVDAAAYITKPVDPFELKQTLDELEKKKARVADERLVVLTDGVVVSIPFADIRSIEKNGRKTIITRIKQPPVYTNQPISELSRQFENFTFFAIISQSNYINLTNALEFNKKERMITMRDGSEVSVARDRMQAVLDRFLMKYGV